MPRFTATARRAWIAAIICIAALIAPATATIFEIDEDELRRESTSRKSPKLPPVDPAKMAESCGEGGKSGSRFTDAEYRRAMQMIDADIGKLKLPSHDFAPLDAMQKAIRKCREDDANKRAAARAGKDCKELLKAHKEAAARAAAYVKDQPEAAKDVEKWGERFREPLKSCLEKKPCRLDSRADMKQALELYQAFPRAALAGEVFHGLKLCGVTVRDIRRWCRRTVGGKQEDICFDINGLREALEKAPNLAPLDAAAPADKGGAVKAGGGKP